MFDNPFRHCLRPPAVLALGMILSVTLLGVAAPAHGFGLSGTQFVEGLGKIGDALESAEEAERHDRSNTEQFVDDKVGEIADQAADRIEQGSIKAGGKAWDALVKSDSKVGELAKKAARRWGPAVRKGLRLAGPAGRVVDTADAGYTVGSFIGEHGVAPLIESYFDGESRELEEQIRRDIEEIRKRGEFSRKLDQDIAALEREARAMDEEERKLYGSDGGGAASDPWREGTGSAERDDTDPETSATPNSWRQHDVVGHRGKSGEEQWDPDMADASRRPDYGTPTCEDDRNGCSGDEYWNRELQEKARQLDPWAAYRETTAAGTREATANRDEWSDASERGCKDRRAGDCSETGLTEDGTSDGLSGVGGSHGKVDSEELSDPSEGKSYDVALQRLFDESTGSSDHGSTTSAGSYLAALEGLEEKERKQREEAERQRERAEEERRRREEAERQREASSSQQATSAPSRSGGVGVWHFEHERVKRDGGERESASAAGPGATAALAPKCTAFEYWNTYGHQKLCWMEIAGRPGCHLAAGGWVSSLVSFFNHQGLMMEDWSGRCSGGMAEGRGTFFVVPREGTRMVEATGTLKDGKPHGHWIFRLSNEQIREGPFVDGKRHGQWVELSYKGLVGEGSYVDDLPHGRWTNRGLTRCDVENYSQGRYLGTNTGAC